MKDVLCDDSLDMERKVIKKSKFRVLFNPLPVVKCNENVRDVDDTSLTPEEKMQFVGQNTGNLVFTESIKEQIPYDIESNLDWRWISDKLGHHNGVSIMPAANFLSRNTTWITSLNPILKNTDIRFTLAGVGAQAGLKDSPGDVVSRLSKRQIEFFNLVSEKAVSIGVRGEFTAECFEKMGIHNIRIIGCPSFYQYDFDYKKLPEPSLDKVVYTYTDKTDKVKAIAREKQAILIRQTYNEWDIHQKIFFCYSKWSQYLDSPNFTFSFGSRFHGNMMALRSRIPTLWIVHDMRTLELVRTLKLPYLNYYSDGWERIRYMEDLLQFCDYSEVYKNYNKMRKEYHEFLEENFMT